MKPFAFAQNEPASSGSPIRSVLELPEAEILIVEDENLMSALMQRYLKTLGLSDFSGHRRSDGQVKVLSIESGWELLNADLGHIRVAVIDVLLPQVTGVDLIRDFRRRYPGMGLVPVSGMATEPMKRSLKELLPEGFELMNKPLRREEFIENFLKAWHYSRSNGNVRALKATPLPFIQNADPGSEPNAIESSLWSNSVSHSNPVVSIMKRKKPLKKAA
ncbi:MAG: response regulator [Bdellovibrionota bacterium]